MTTASKTAAPFEWLGGHPGLDFCNTRSWGDDRRSEERLLTYASLVRWADEAGLVSDGAELLGAAEREPAEAAAVLARARSLRRLLHELFAGPATNGGVDRSRLDEFNRLLREAAGGLEIAHDSSGAYGWQWCDTSLAGPLRPIVWAAAELLISGQPVGLCANPDCGWLFIDRSRRGNRRWCDMKVCGSRDKARRYYRRRKAAAGD